MLSAWSGVSDLLLSFSLYGIATVQYHVQLDFFLLSLSLFSFLSVVVVVTFTNDLLAYKLPLTHSVYDVIKSIRHRKERCWHADLLLVFLFFTTREGNKPNLELIILQVGVLVTHIFVHFPSLSFPIVSCAMSIIGAQKSCSITPRPIFRNARPSFHHRSSLLSLQALRLVPSGDGNTDHINGTIDLATVSPLTLKDGIFEVGRVETADLVVPLPTVSARHAIVSVENNTVTVTDIGSTNGTVVDDTELKPNQTPTPLAIGSTVIFGDKHLAAFTLVDVDDEPVASAE